MTDLPRLTDNLATVLVDLGRLRHVGLLTDFDGTISEIVPSSDAAHIQPGCRAALARLQGRVALLGVVSGRTLTDVRGLVGLDGIRYAGCHGLEWFEDGQSVRAASVSDVRPAIAAARDELAALIQGLPGVTLEDKGVMLAAHYRQAAEPEAARSALLSALSETAARTGLRVAEGRMVIELRPKVQANKGTAAARMLREAPSVHAAIVLGDDLTDADAFRAVHDWADADPQRVGLAFAVLSAETPEALLAEADYAVQGVAEVETFLAWLAAQQ
ncbi:MAG: trehalose-phosphatase [Chloroflexi bacterium]|nr:trehalose-phosphatase [Chloroflexota bacterium]